MKKNKSIDGLEIRDAKNLAPTSATPIKVTAKSSKAKVPVATKPAVKTTTKPVVKPAVKKVKTTEPVITKPTREQAVEDFLKPVQAFNFDGETGELTASDEPIDKNAKKTKKEKKEKKKPGKVRRVISIIALLIVLALIGLITWAVLWGNDIIAKITGGQGNVLDLIKFIEPTYEPLKTDANGRTNILAFGTSGYNMEGDEGNGVHAGAQLTDSIMAISLNQETGDIAMISLPRDLKASPTCTATGKINEIYWCNNMYKDNEAGGANALMAEVGDILGMDFQYYAHLNWGSLVSIVDILGGITVTLDEGIYDYWWTGAVYEPGVPYTLNGEQALGLSRARHGTSGGDFSRGSSQQKILVGIKNKILEKELSIPDIIGLASALGDNFRSNFSIDELKSAAHLTFDFDFESMRQISLWPDYMRTGTLDNGISYVFPRAGVGVYGPIQELVATQLSNDPRAYEDPTILILNATGEPGVASAERTKLEAEGYTITAIDNAPEDAEFKKTLTFYTNHTKPGTEDLIQKYYNLEQFQVDSLSDAPASISRNYDFVIVIGPSPVKDAEEE
jgi:LCP family protein required for cell wall assembly